MSRFRYEETLAIANEVRSHPYNPQAEREKVLDELEKWLYEEGMKFEKICDSEENYTDAASACARRAQCYYTIEKLKELREGKDGE
jgi:hypothetical protein